MIVVYPDSNALHKNPYLLGPPMETLLAEVEAVHGELRISRVVLDELRRQEMDDVAAVQETVNALVQKRTRGHPAKMSQIQLRITNQLDAVRNEIEGKLAAAISPDRIVRDDYPDVSARELVDRDIQRRRPFIETEVSGGKGRQTIGMRDTLIWEGVRACARRGGAEQILIFITDDHGFLNDKKSALHHDLLADLQVDGTDSGRIIHARTISQASIKLAELRAFIDKEQAAVASEIVSLALQLEGTEIGWKFDPRDGGLIESGLDGIELRQELEASRIVAVDIVDNPDVSGTGPYRASVTVELSITGSMWAADWYAVEDDTDLELWDDNGRYVDLGMVRRVVVAATIAVTESGILEHIEELQVKPATSGVSFDTRVTEFDLADSTENV